MPGTNARTRAVRWLICGVALAALHGLIAFLSFDFQYGTPLSGRPIIWFVCIELLAGLVYLAAVWGCWQRPSGRWVVIWVLGIGALIRLILLCSSPVLEDDFYRYLWDGGVLAHGHNPYVAAPAKVTDPESGIPPSLSRLAQQSGVVHERINYPHLRTIYPPVAEAAFALAHWVAPWELAGWRLVILFVELAAVAFLVLLIQEAALPPAALALYWWNPLVVKELVNSAHMDVLILPLVLGAVLLVIRERHVLAALMLAMAVGTKLWPIALVPVLFRSLLRRPRRLALTLAIFWAAALAITIPYVVAATGEQSGLLAYGRLWEMNDPLFMLILWGVRRVAEQAGDLPVNAQHITRAMVALAFCACVGWLARRRAGSPADLCEKCLLVGAALFLLSPTQFPWYALWFAPLLAVRPRLSLLLLTVLLPLYYLRFYFLSIDRPEVFDYGVVFAEFVPVWILLGREAWSGHTWANREIAR